MTIRELLDELERIAEMQAMIDSMNRSSAPGNARASQLLSMSISRTQSRLRDRFSSSQIEAAMRMRRILSEQTA